MLKSLTGLFSIFFLRDYVKKSIVEVIKIKCLCGKKVILNVGFGQYYNEYRGECECGLAWNLSEISELLEEIEEKTNSFLNR